jgi:hypothetical protein
MSRLASPTSPTATDTMTDDSTQSRFLVRLKRAVRTQESRAQRVGAGLVEHLKERVDQKLAPILEQKARALLLELSEPQNARRLQSALAGLAQMAIKSGFRQDPQARLLFELADELEERHSRETVLRTVLEHAIAYEHELLAIVVDAVRAPDAAEGFDAADYASTRKRAGDKVLALLCALASLERDVPPPQLGAHPTQVYVDYFESAPLDSRFKPLARMAAGHSDAFEQPKAAQDEPSNEAGLVRRLIGRVSGGQSAEAKSSALSRLVPSLADPATRFVTVSYLFFVQSYLVRALVEDLPQMLEAVRELEIEQQRSDTDVVDIGD